MTSTALAAVGSMVTTGPAQSAPPAGDCATPANVDDLAKGDAVTGWTVTGLTSPTDPETFDGEVLGVLRDGIAPGLDMVMVQVDPPASWETGMPEVKGIWQGMSGSPVYDDGGDLVGAVAYGMAYGPSWVAGVTPFAEMDDYVDTPPPPRVKVTDAQARTISRSSELSRAQAQRGFRQLQMPVTLSGLTQHRLKMARKAEGHHLFKGGWMAGSAGTASIQATDADLVAGGNLAAELSYGDITAAGVGTVTSVCDDQVVGFGHPMTFTGKTTLGLAPADALYIQGDPLGAPFKLANIGEPVGTIDDDHLTGITGSFGATPDATDVTSEVAYGDRNREGTSHALLQSYTADVLFSQVLANHDRVVDAIMPGSEQLTYLVNGTDAAGTHFTIDYADQYQSDYDVSFDSVWEVADATYALSQMPGVTIDHITVGSDVSDDAMTWKVKTAELRTGGSWTKLTRRTMVKAHRGDVLQLRATLLSDDGDSTTVPLSVKVPRSAKRYAELSIVGGGSVYSNGVYRADTPQELGDALTSGPKNDQVQAALTTYTRRSSSSRTTTSDSQSHVVYGSKGAVVKIAR